QSRPEVRGRSRIEGAQIGRVQHRAAVLYELGGEVLRDASAVLLLVVHDEDFPLAELVIGVIGASRSLDQVGRADAEVVVLSRRRPDRGGLALAVAVSRL